LASHLLSDCSTPSQAVQRAEQQARIQEVLNGMDEMDREVLASWHFEQLTNPETAAVLGLGEATASNRFVRGLRTLKQVLHQTDRRRIDANYTQFPLPMR
jgi:RNA polymerase sigma factor (sigma-70 family)